MRYGSIFHGFAARRYAVAQINPAVVGYLVHAFFHVAVQRVKKRVCRCLFLLLRDGVHREQDIFENGKRSEQLLLRDVVHPHQCLVERFVFFASFLEFLEIGGQYGGIDGRQYAGGEAGLFGYFFHFDSFLPEETDTFVYFFQFVHVLFRFCGSRFTA